MVVHLEDRQALEVLSWAPVVHLEVLPVSGHQEWEVHYRQEWSVLVASDFPDLQEDLADHRWVQTAQ